MSLTEAEMDGTLFKVCESDSGFDIARKLIECVEDDNVKSLSVSDLKKLAGHLLAYVDAREYGKAD